MRSDLAFIDSVVRDQAAPVAVELGTGPCGLSFVLAAAQAAHGGELFTFDDYGRENDAVALEEAVPRLLRENANVTFYREDVVVPNYRVFRALSGAVSLLFCDNGNKEAELANYAPHIGPGGIIGCHDYNREVRRSWAEPFLKDLGYVPFREEEAQRLDWEFEYGSSRFWKRN